MPETTRTRALGGATPSTLNPETRTVEVIALSGFAPAVRPAPAPDGAAERWIEELDAAGADLSRFIGGPVLKDHRPTTDNAVGVVDGARVEGGSGGRILATVRFATKPAADELMADVGGGIVRGVSCGYRVTTWRAAGRRDGLRVFRAVAWEPYELSFTPVPVDAGATVRSKTMPDDIAFKPCETCATPNGCKKLGGCVTEAEGNTSTDAAPGAPAGTGDDAPAGNGTRAHVNGEIRSIGRVAGLPATFADGLIDRGATVDEARAAAFAELARRGGGPIRTAATVGVDHTDPATMRRSMADALAARLCPSLVKPEGRAREFMGHRALDMVGELATARGERLNRFNQTALLERAIGAHSTSDFPMLLQDAANKVLLAQYAAANPTYRQWAARRSFNDFKPAKFLRVGDFPSLKNLAETGELTYGTMSENRETVSANEYATGIILDRRALMNDDLGALGDFSMMIAVRTAADENRLVYGLLKSNPQLSDGKPLFHAAHGNLTGGAAVNVASVSAAVAALRKQKSLDGIPLNLAPRFLVVGPDKELEGRQLLAAIVANQTSAVNPWAGLMELVVDANVEGNAWHLFCDPALCPTVVYGYVNGAEGPQIKTETDFDSQAVKVRAGIDFGYGAIDFRGAHANPGN